FLNLPKMNDDSLSVELLITDDKAEVVLSKNKQRLQDFARDAERIQPQIKFKIPNENFIDLDKLEKKAAETRKQFQQVTSARLDAGNIGSLTREIINASERSRQLTTDIANIKKELSNPNRKSSIAFLTDELRAAEKEAEQLDRKLNTLSSANLPAGKSTVAGRSGAGGGKRGRVSDTAATFLELSDDFAPEGLNRAYNAATRSALAFNAVSMTSLGIFGAIALAGYGIVKVTENIRTEAERRLQVEFQIQGAINNQILSQKEGLANSQKIREEAQKAWEFNRFLNDSSVEELTRRKTNLERLQKMLPVTLPVVENGKVIAKPNEDYLKYDQQLLALDEQIRATRQRNAQTSNEAFDNRWKSYVKSQDDAREAEQKRLKQQNESIEKAKKQVLDLEKTYNSVFESLYQKQGINNPFFQIFSESGKAANDLKVKLAGLNPELQAAALQMQKTLNAKALLSARLDNRVDAFDLREQASNFRNPFDPEKLKTEEEEFIKRFLYNNPNYLYLKNKKEVDADTRKDILSFGLFDTPQSRLNKSLDEKFDLIYGRGKLSPEQQATADRKFLSITQGVSPLELSNGNREQAALVREREAARRERYEQDAMALYREQRDLQKKIEANTARQNKIAEEKGEQGIKMDITTDNGVKDVRQIKTPTAADTQSFYNPELNFTGGGGLTNR
ncbi:MAG TPA: hypothetical protein VGB68_02835, partial [Pyrinomonadaceae bacterium]